jgi:hypothetical protein
MMENQERNRAKGQIIRIHEKRVKRQQGLIEVKQFLIANTDANDPKRIKLLEDVSELHDTLQVLMQDLDAAEETAIEDAMKMELESTFLAHDADNDCIDLTIDQIIHGNEKVHSLSSRYKKPEMNDFDLTPRTIVGKQRNEVVDDTGSDIQMIPRNLAAEEEKNESEHNPPLSDTD